MDPRICVAIDKYMDDGTLINALFDHIELILNLFYAYYLYYMLKIISLHQMKISGTLVHLALIWNEVDYCNRC